MILQKTFMKDCDTDENTFDESSVNDKKAG